MPDRNILARDWTEDPGTVHWVAGAPRTASLEDVWARAAGQFAPCGVTRVADLTGLDVLGIPVAAAYRPNSRSLAVAQGKGVSPLAARVSAAMEAIEHDHAERVAAPLRVARATELPRALDLTGLARTDDADLTGTLLWLEARHLWRRDTCWAPFSAVLLDTTAGARYLHRGFVQDSNGLASGASRLEAVLHAVLEVVERDAAAWWDTAGEPASPGIDVVTLPDVGAVALWDRILDAGLSAVCRDLTTDVGAPSFRVELVDADADPVRALPVAVGYGCHPHPGVAALRAATEAVQTRMVHVSGARDDLDRTTFVTVRAADVVDAGRAAVRHAGAQARPWTRAWHSGTLAEDLAQVLDGLAAVGVTEGCVIDLSRAGTGIAVVKVLVSGLEGAWALGTPDVVPGPRQERWLTESTAAKAPDRVGVPA